MRRIRVTMAALVLAAGARHVALADTGSFTPSRDNSIYSEPDTSNGAGAHLFSGQTSFLTQRRALMRFPFSDTINPGSTVSSVGMRLRCSRSPIGPPVVQTFSLHRLTADWGEGVSDGGEPGGIGAPAEPNDATWSERFFGANTPWATAGGDFVATPSATFNVGTCSPIEPYTLITVSSTPQLVADVQGWVANPASNFGWIVIGNEVDPTTARRFVSREHTTANLRPLVTVTYTQAPAGPGTVPDGDGVPGVPLLLDTTGANQLLLSWGDSCSSGAIDYAIYEGTLGSFSSHGFLQCSTGGLLQATITPAASDSYYLVVPLTATREGSYGRDSAGNERSQGAPTCLVQDLPGSICP